MDHHAHHPTLIGAFQDHEIRADPAYGAIEPDLSLIHGNALLQYASTQHLSHLIVAHLHRMNGP